MTGREGEMSEIKEKAIGKAKQVIAEITGDGKLHQEGVEQEKNAKKGPREGPLFPDLNQLT
jgi:uncharacterized protein YjbJ (UPF0337 family)